MRLPLTSSNYVTLVIVHAPTMTIPDEAKDILYQQLDEVVRNVPSRDKLIVI